MPKDIIDITKDFMRDPARILVKKENLTLEGIRQFYVAIPDESQKFQVLSDIYKNIGISDIKRLNFLYNFYRNSASSNLLHFTQESRIFDK